MAFIYLAKDEKAMPGYIKQGKAINASKERTNKTIAPHYEVIIDINVREEFYSEIDDLCKSELGQSYERFRFKNTKRKSEFFKCDYVEALEVVTKCIANFNENKLEELLKKTDRDLLKQLAYQPDLTFINCSPLDDAALINLSHRYIKLFENTEGDSKHHLGYLLYLVNFEEKANHCKIITQIEEMANNGSDEASLILSDTEIIQDFKSAHKGNSESQLRLATHFKCGVELFLLPNISIAEFWYRESADSGNRNAQSELADLLYESGVEENLIEAIQWYKTLSEQSDLYSKAMLCKIYVSKALFLNVKEGFNLASELADAGDIQGLYYLAQCFEYGWGTDICLDKAFYYYMESSKKGFSLASFSLGKLLDNEDKNNEALLHYKKALENEDLMLSDVYLIVGLWRIGEYEEAKMVAASFFGSIDSQVRFSISKIDARHLKVAPNEHSETVDKSGLVNCFLLDNRDFKGIFGKWSSIYSCDLGSVVFFKQSEP